MRRSVVVGAVVLAVGCQEQYAQLKAGMAEGYGAVMPGASSINEMQFVHVQGDLVAPIDAHAGRCALPLHEDDYAGFSVGRPPGWVIDYSTGSLIVAKDATKMVGALVYPARLRQGDVPPERLATEFARGLERNVKLRGGTFDLQEQKTNGKIATAVAVATSNGVALRGVIQVVETPGFMELKAY